MSNSSGFIGGGGSHVQQLVAGTGITLSPTSGFGVVTINSSDGANVMLVDGGLCSTYRCGVSNSAYGSYAFSGGGQCNEANGNYSFVGGGFCNCTTACSAILGGLNNNASAPFSGAFGCNINACNACTFYSNNLCSCGISGASTCVTSPLVCGTTSMASPFFSASNCVSSPIVSGTTCVTSPLICGTTSVCTPTLISTNACVTGLTNGCAVCSNGSGQLISYSPTIYTQPIIIQGTGCNSTLRCGVVNCASGGYSFSGGGQCNIASGNCSAILGGFGNSASASFSGAFGCNINACNACTFYSNNLCACGNTSSITANVTCLTSGQAVCSGSNGILTNYTAASAKSYGSFFDTTTQSGIANSVLTMSLNNSDPWNSGVSVLSGNRITLANAGVYNIQFSAQMVKTSGNSASHAHIWLSKNGLAVPISASQIGFPSNSVYVVAAWNFFFQTTTPNEYVQLQWEINSNVDNGISLQYQPPSGNIPAIPSIILTVNQL